jgi:carbamoyltransferase
MKVLAVNFAHDASVCLMSGGRVEFYSKEERFTRIKRDTVGSRTIAQLAATGMLDDLDEMAVSVWSDAEDRSGYADWFDSLRARLAPRSRFTVVRGEHHLFHAANAFTASGFDRALAFVFDGGGAVVGAGGAREKESVYLFEGAGYERLHLAAGLPPPLAEPGIAEVYDGASRRAGIRILEAGKTMGLVPYGRAGAVLQDLPVPDAITPANHLPYADIARAAQERTQAAALELIRHWVARTGVVNVCVTGGYAMNSIANFHYRSHLPSDVALFADPLADDGGISIGLASIRSGLVSRPYRDLYFSGFHYDDPVLPRASAGEVAGMIAAGCIGAVYRGRAEAGQRALGNRSIVCDPRRLDGRDAINRVKRREWYRPFAATVLAETARSWFDLGRLDESAFMTYVVPVHAAAAHRIPAVLHIDGTSRIQTIHRDHNPDWYDLVAAFGELTGVPMLLNTSFNLAGDPLVETVPEAFDAFHSAKLDFIWFAGSGALATRCDPAFTP